MNYEEDPILSHRSESTIPNLGRLAEVTARTEGERNLLFQALQAAYDNGNISPIDFANEWGAITGNNTDKIINNLAGIAPGVPVLSMDWGSRRSRGRDISIARSDGTIAIYNADPTYQITALTGSLDENRLAGILITNDSYVGEEVIIAQCQKQLQAPSSTPGDNGDYSLFDFYEAVEIWRLAKQIGIAIPDSLGTELHLAVARAAHHVIAKGRHSKDSAIYEALRDDALLNRKTDIIDSFLLSANWVTDSAYDLKEIDCIIDIAENGENSPFVEDEYYPFDAAERIEHEARAVLRVLDRRKRLLDSQE